MNATAAVEPVIRVRGVSKVYRLGEVDVCALHEVDLDLYAAEFVVILGASGSGKSTSYSISSTRRGDWETAIA